MSKQKRDCYHCKIIKQAKLHYESGVYGREEIVEHMLSALADFIANTSEIEGRVDIIADCMRKGIAGKLHERVLGVQIPVGWA